MRESLAQAEAIGSEAVLLSTLRLSSALFCTIDGLYHGSQVQATLVEQVTSECLSKCHLKLQAVAFARKMELTLALRK
eukprot:12243521-Alexandrium_andersonii.AAC.1